VTRLVSRLRLETIVRGLKAGSYYHQQGVVTRRQIRLHARSCGVSARSPASRVVHLVKSRDRTSRGSSAIPGATLLSKSADRSAVQPAMRRSMTFPPVNPLFPDVTRRRPDSPRAQLPRRVLDWRPPASRARPGQGLRRDPQHAGSGRTSAYHVTNAVVERRPLRSVPLFQIEDLVVRLYRRNTMAIVTMTAVEKKSVETSAVDGIPILVTDIWSRTHRWTLCERNTSQVVNERVAEDRGFA
jgi:hypothetical protein